jgi:hypothetical protein
VQQPALGTLLLIGALAGCASLEGTWSPDCVAHSGNRITLDGGRFVWDKFTDQVLVNDAGDVVDMYPEYPLRGRYSMEGDTIRFESYTGEPLPVMHLQREAGKTYLLTDKQRDAWHTARPRCPLTLDSP